nr:MAG TPA: homing endonuclease [Caudoviricetes sp.]
MSHKYGAKKVTVDEVWKDILGYEGIYQVSNLGNIKSLSREVAMPNGGVRLIKELIKVPSTDNDGYYHVGLSQNGKMKTFTIHRLVALHFLEINPSKNIVNHIDEDKNNNKAENLEWVTHTENMNHGTIAKRKSESISSVKTIKNKANSNNKLGVSNISKVKNSAGVLYYLFSKSIKGSKTKRYFRTFEQALDFKKEFYAKLQKEQI